MRRRQGTLLLLMGAACGLALIPFQQPTFKTGVQLVRIDVSVLDDKRQPVRGLQAADFTVLEDGQARPVRAFRFVDHAAPSVLTGATSTTTATSSLPSVATNQAGDETSRLIVIMMDRSIPTERPMLVARQIADAAVDAMAPGDLAAIVTSGGGVPQNFTSDRARLHRTIAASDWSRQLSQAQKDDPIIKMMGLDNPMEDGRCLCGLCVLETITRVANDLRNVPRRKVLLFVGSNIILQVVMPANNPGLSCDKLVSDAREALFDALGTSGLTVHSIDPNGLATVGPTARATVVNGNEGTDARDLNNQLTSERSAFIKAQGNLEVLPELTGGRRVVNDNEPFRLVPDVLRESEAYYLLAFEPLETTGEVRHRIEVKVARKSVAVHTARFVPPSSPPPADTASPLDVALTSVLSDASLPLRMAVAALAGPDRDHAYVGITLDASAFATGGPVPLQVAVVASDERGKSIASAQQKTTIDVPALPPGAVGPPVDVQTYLTLAPGDYELRGAIMNSTTRATASVFTHITVPAFDRAPLSLSDAVLGMGANRGSLPESPIQMPVEPTATRSFDVSARVSAFLRVYRTEGGTPVTIESTVLRTDGTVVDTQSQQLTDGAFHAGGADLRVPLPLVDLDPGSYTLRIVARQGIRSASQTIAFAVRP